MVYVKRFKEDFALLLDKFKRNENFAFLRFSDGELFILQNKKLQLNEYGTFVDEILCGPIYGKEDFKEFLPSEHQFLREKLLASIKHKQHNYFVGLSCPCCVSWVNYKWMLDLLPEKTNYTWANLFVNSNYPIFIKTFVPEFKNKKIVLICNENADLSNSQLNLVKDFRIGRNAMINDIDLYKRIGEWIENNEIKDHVFCFSASSLTNVTIFELFQKYPNNTYLDIGTTLNPIFGFPCSRGYLQAYWTGQDHPDLHKTCIWI